MKAIEDRLLRSKLSFLFSLSSHSLIKEKERKKELHEDAHKREKERKERKRERSFRSLF
jgi:hypothetical protein